MPGYVRVIGGGQEDCNGIYRCCEAGTVPMSFQVACGFAKVEAPQTWAKLARTDIEYYQHSKGAFLFHSHEGQWKLHEPAGPCVYVSASLLTAPSKVPTYGWMPIKEQAMVMPDIEHFMDGDADEAEADQ
uniref:Uncharacterized protein n=1 Tax=Craspedostauros australis TaxID=1486917 RepID=A0A6T6FEU3_9STRA|mmetsp:Transcript_2055/g.5695  ORF Transcript_2055/g.5695 Transcript_2055/m.5695 type:complete len:130 (+) Transcript_2055:156-545(+)|eukprot:CAMPEP_0198115900 /NCGR_PEP_ID=MMETSP1442-20131203/7937_1 /TAXON_ID= /ORGANISM="Craspedostauros australis, Strain CCMP3328" /LENGTH=129 /DNA_ID=CAMNT_0043773503 /DNA_START=91 /DNA_END=480 /DNA_ORIENTATION=+